MSNHAGQYFMPGRSCRMPARLSGDARLLARLAAACRAVWQALLVRAQAPTGLPAAYHVLDYRPQVQSAQRLCRLWQPVTTLRRWHLCF